MKFSTKVPLIRNSMEFSHGVRRALVLSLALIYFVQAGFDIIWIGTLFAVSGIISIFMEFPTGAVADYDSRKKSLMISYFLFAFAFLGIYFSNNFWLIAVFWILSDVAWTFSTGAGSAWAIDALGIGKSKSKIVRLMSRGYLSAKSGNIIGGMIGLVIVAINFRLIWLISGLVALFMFFFIWRYMEERNFEPEKIPSNYLMKSWIKAKESYQFIFGKRNRNLRVLMLSDNLRCVGFAIFYFAMPLFFTQILNVGADSYSGILSGVAFVSLIGPFLVERFSEHSGFGKMLFRFTILSSVVIFLFTGFQLVAVAVLLLAIFDILGTALDVSYDSACHHEFDSRIRASLGSVNSINYTIFDSIGVFLAGILVSSFGIGVALLTSGGIVFLTGFGYLLMKE